jgi:hypothetical protein
LARAGEWGEEREGLWGIGVGYIDTRVAGQQEVANAVYQGTAPWAVHWAIIITIIITTKSVYVQKGSSHPSRLGCGCGRERERERERAAR